MLLRFTAQRLPMGAGPAAGSSAPPRLAPAPSPAAEQHRVQMHPLVSFSCAGGRPGLQHLPAQPGSPHGSRWMFPCQSREAGGGHRVGSSSFLKHSTNAPRGARPRSHCPQHSGAPNKASSPDRLMLPIGEHAQGSSNTEGKPRTPCPWWGMKDVVPPSTFPLMPHQLP